MKKGLIISLTVLVLAVGAGAAWYFVGQQNKGPAVNSTSDSGVTNENDTSKLETEDGITIIINDEGFDEDSYTVKGGESVTIRNNSAAVAQFSSSDHPTHLEHPELNMDALLPGESTTFIAKTKGTYGFHDHLKDENTGTLVVQ
jgi:hypothetical protein